MMLLTGGQDWGGGRRRIKEVRKKEEDRIVEGIWRRLHSLTC